MFKAVTTVIGTTTISKHEAGGREGPMANETLVLKIAVGGSWFYSAVIKSISNNSLMSNMRKDKVPYAQSAEDGRLADLPHERMNNAT